MALFSPNPAWVKIGRALDKPYEKRLLAGYRNFCDEKMALARGTPYLDTRI